MAAIVRQKFSSQATPDILEALREIARSEGRQFQSVLDEALRDYVHRKRQGVPRQPVLRAFADSLKEFDALYRELAK